MQTAYKEGRGQTLKETGMLLSKDLSPAGNSNSTPHWLCLRKFPDSKIKLLWDFCGGAVVKNPPANAGDRDSSPVPGRFHMPQGS